MTSALILKDLRVALPDGRILIDGLDLEMAQGEVIVLLGGSGAGKSTLARVLFEREELDAAGFSVTAQTLQVDRDQLGLVPQRGALFDHLDIKDNIELAQRYSVRSSARDQGRPMDPSAPGQQPAPQDAAAWLRSVGLDPVLAQAGKSVTQLSGGQAQRVAVARVLASNRQLLFLDEPSVGLDPQRVRMLARLIRQQVKTLGVSAIVVTHDVALAAGVADRLFLLSLEDRKLQQLFINEWPGALEDPGHSEALRGQWLVRLEAELVSHLDTFGDKPAPRCAPTKQALTTRFAQWASPFTAPFVIAMQCLLLAPKQLLSKPRDFAVISKRVVVQTLLRPLLFYAIVSTLIGYTVLFVISKVGGAGVRPDAVLRQIGGAYVVALAPALSALLFVAASGSATNAWLGSMSLTKQTLALDALGVNRRMYLWAPAWMTVAISYLVVAVVFGLGMIVGGLLVCRSYGVADAWQMLTADFVDPRPERAPYAWRAAFLVWMYGWGIASDTVAKGGAAKLEADHVTRAMTASVIACTLWVVAWELLSVIVVLQR